MNGYTVVPFSHEHLDGAAAIEAATFSEPWSREAMKLLCTADYPSLALVDTEGRTVGYIGAVKVLDELQIINVAVSASLRKMGLGNMLMREFEALCQRQSIATVSLEVRESNAAAISLYKKFGFEITGRRKRFYKAPTEDALVMVKNRFEDANKENL